MSGTKLRIETALGAMRLVAETDYASLVHAWGITEEDYKAITGPVLWLPERRERLRAVMHQFASGVMDLCGVQRFEMPAEFMAAVIAVFVHPTNTLPACVIFDRPRSAYDIRGENMNEAVSPSLLFSLVCDIYYSSDGIAIKASFEKNVGRAIQKSLEGGDTNGAQSKNRKVTQISR